MEMLTHSHEAAHVNVCVGEGGVLKYYMKCRSQKIGKNKLILHILYTYTRNVFSSIFVISADN